MHTGRLLMAQLQLSAVFESHLPRILPPTLQNNNDRNKSRRLFCLIAAFPFLQLCRAPSDPTFVDAQRVPGPLAQPPRSRGRGDAHDPRPAAGGGSGPPPAGAAAPYFSFFPTGYEIRLRGEGSGGCSGHAGSHATAAACLASGEIVTGQGLFSPGTASSEFLEVGCSRNSAEQLAKAHRVALRLFPGSGVQPGTVLYSIPSRRKMPAAIIQPICPKRKALVKPRP